MNDELDTLIRSEGKFGEKNYDVILRLIHGTSSPDTGKEEEIMVLKKEIKRLKNTNHPMTKSIDSILIEFDEKAKEYLRTHPQAMNDVKVMRGWLEEMV